MAQSIDKPRIMVGVTGGVAAYKAAELVRELQQRGCEVRVAMTRAAEEFVRPLTFSSLTGHKVLTSLWGSDASAGEKAATGLDDAGQIEHIAEALWPGAVVIAPATAHFLAKMAHGVADDFLTTMLLATTAPVVVAPAMNVNMWRHPATRANVSALRERGVRFVDPDAGYLACRMMGSGRLADVSAIADAVMELASQPMREAANLDLSGETVLVTAGGTREAIDPVRYLGNRSSGKMGYAVAEAARQRGAEVILVSAPSALAPPAGCAFDPVTTAEEMRAAVMDHLPRATIVIGAAAVADFRAASVSAAKLRRDGSLTIELEPTEDIVRAVSAARNPGTLVVAFAAEMDCDVERARAKMRAKGADAIVLNDVSRAGLGFDSDRNAATFITQDSAIALGEMPKRQMADHILDRVCALRAAVLSAAP